MRRLRVVAEEHRYTFTGKRSMRSSDGDAPGAPAIGPRSIGETATDAASSSRASYEIGTGAGSRRKGIWAVGARAFDSFDVATWR